MFRFILLQWPATGIFKPFTSLITSSVTFSLIFINLFLRKTFSVSCHPYHSPSLPLYRNLSLVRGLFNSQPMGSLPAELQFKFKDYSIHKPCSSPTELQFKDVSAISIRITIMASQARCLPVLFRSSILPFCLPTSFTPYHL